MTTNENDQQSFADLLDANPDLPGDNPIYPGDQVTGHVVMISDETVFIDYGGKAEAWASRAELTDEEGNLTVAEGDEIELTLLEYGPSGAHLGKHFQRGLGQDGLRQIGQAYESGIPIEGHVAKTIKGGFEVTIAGARAFCPISQIDIEFVQEAELFVDQSYLFKVVEYEADSKHPNVVVSRREVLQEERDKQAEQTRTRLEIGADFECVVRKLMPYGVFVDMGGLDGFIHISELARRRVNAAEEVVSVGQHVTAQVIKLETDDRGRERISLSMRVLESDPWEDGLPFTDGSTLVGKVMRHTDFGIFVELVPGVEGLLHRSEISYDRDFDASSEYPEGSEIELKVLSIDLEKRRISLSKKALQMQDLPEAELPENDSDSRTRTRSGNVIRRRKDQTQEEESPNQPEVQAAPEVPEASFDEDMDRWEQAMQKEAPKAPTPRVGLVTQGIIADLMPYGAFVDLPELGDRMRGLVHNTELVATEGNPQQGLKEGDPLEVEIIRIDEKGRLSLSHKKVQMRKEREEYSKFMNKQGKSTGTSMADLLKGIKLDK